MGSDNSFLKIIIIIKFLFDNLYGQKYPSSVNSSFFYYFSFYRFSISPLKPRPLTPYYAAVAVVFCAGDRRRLLGRLVYEWCVSSSSSIRTPPPHVSCLPSIFVPVESSKPLVLCYYFFQLHQFRFVWSCIIRIKIIFDVGLCCLDGFLYL